MKLEVINLSKKFKDILAVNGVSFTIKKNKTMGLLGPRSPNVLFSSISKLMLSTATIELNFFNKFLISNFI